MILLNPYFIQLILKEFTEMTEPTWSNEKYNRNKNLPQNQELPIFTYGMFKKGEIASHRFRKLKNLIYKPAIVKDYIIKAIGGFPVAVYLPGCEIKGYILSCNNNRNIYTRIRPYGPGKIYEWITVTATLPNDETVPVNILVADETTDDSANKIYYINTWEDQILDYDEIPEWHTKNDTLFQGGMKYLEAKYFNTLCRPLHNRDQTYNIAIKHLSDSNGQDTGNHSCFSDQQTRICELFELQMGYTFLWSIIDRFCSFRYSIQNTQKGNVNSLQNDPVIKEAIKLIDWYWLNREDIAVHSFQDSKVRNFNKHKCLSFYYQVRNNSVHRSKDNINDYMFLRNCFLELFVIMDYAINIIVFKKNSDEEKAKLRNRVSQWY